MGSPRSKSHASVCIFCRQDYAPGQTPVKMSGDLSAHTRCFDENQSKPLSTYVPIQESVTRIVQVLSQYPNVCSAVKPLIGIELEYTPEQIFRICFSMVLVSASSETTTWDEILKQSQDMSLDIWELPLEGALMMLGVNGLDSERIIRAFKNLEGVYKSLS